MRFPTLSSVLTLPQMCQSRFSLPLILCRRLWLNRRWLIRANNFRELAEPFDIAASSRNGYIVDAIGGYLAKDETDIYRLIESLWREDCRTMGRKTLRSSTVWAVAMHDGIDPTTFPPLQCMKWREGRSAV